MKPLRCRYCRGLIRDGDYTDHEECGSEASRYRHDEIDRNDYPERDRNEDR